MTFRTDNLNWRRGAAITLFGLLALVAQTPGEVEASLSSERGRTLVEAMVAKVGSMAKLHARKDVEYTYLYRDHGSGQLDVSVERYLFDGQLSWARYDVHEKHIVPTGPGVVVQGYDGKEVWVTHNGKAVDDPQAIGVARFMRPTNFYWFAMMPKLLDPGIVYDHIGPTTVNGIAYEVVDIRFGDMHGEKSDRYRLYINSETKLVDRFLFTVVDFGKTDPFLMEVEYEEVDGLWLPMKRRYTPSNWEGELGEAPVWIDEIMLAVRFDNGFTPQDFRRPAAP